VVTTVQCAHLYVVYLYWLLHVCSWRQRITWRRFTLQFVSPLTLTLLDFRTTPVASCLPTHGMLRSSVLLQL